MNITGSIFINDDESGLHQDYEKWLEGLAPEKPYAQYKHNGYEDNADAHLKRTIMGRETVIAITSRVDKCICDSYYQSSANSQEEGLCSTYWIRFVMHSKSYCITA